MVWKVVFKYEEKQTMNMNIILGTCIFPSLVTLAIWIWVKVGMPYVGNDKPLEAGIVDMIYFCTGIIMTLFVWLTWALYELIMR